MGFGGMAEKGDVSFEAIVVDYPQKLKQFEGIKDTTLVQRIEKN